MTNFFERYTAQFQNRYPDTARALDLKERVSPTLICPHKVQLPHSLADQATQIVRAFFRLRSIPERDRDLSARHPQVADPGNTSVLMSYDFHVDENSNLRLIEINTNASASLLSDLLYDAHNLKNPFCEKFEDEILSCFKREAELALPGQEIRVAVITDENPQEQRMFVEFLMYQELFRRIGWDTSIADTRELSFSNEHGLRLGDKKVDLVYNRHTDFYFENVESRALHAAMAARAACITPHPHEYRLLADKERLLELSKAGAIEALPISEEDREAIGRALIRTVDVHDFASADELWKDRKRWFFKTKQSFGGKAAYRGASMSRGAFERVISGPYLAQEYVPAPTIRPPGSDQEFKYDLRFFVYNDRIQLACARLYQGQLTNSQTPGGGLAAIEWV